MYCQSWAWSSPTSSWLGNRLWPYVSSLANPIRRPKGFIKNNVRTRGLISFASSVDSVNMRCWGLGGRLQGFPWLLLSGAIGLSRHHSCPGKCQEKMCWMGREIGGSWETGLQFQLCLTPAALALSRSSSVSYKIGLRSLVLSRFKLTGLCAIAWSLTPQLCPPTPTFGSAFVLPSPPSCPCLTPFFSCLPLGILRGPFGALGELDYQIGKRSMCLGHLQSKGTTRNVWKIIWYSLLRIKKKSQSSWGKKQTFAGLLYTYLQFVVLIEFLFGGILPSVQYEDRWKLNLLPLNFLDSAFSLKPQRGSEKMLLCSVPFSLYQPCVCLFCAITCISRTLAQSRPVYGVLSRWTFPWWG